MWPLILTKVTRDYYVHFLQYDLSIPIEGTPLHVITYAARTWQSVD